MNIYDKGMDYYGHSLMVNWTRWHPRHCRDEEVSNTQNVSLKHLIIHRNVSLQIFKCTSWDIDWWMKWWWNKRYNWIIPIATFTHFDYWQDYWTCFVANVWSSSCCLFQILTFHNGRVSTVYFTNNNNLILFFITMIKLFVNCVIKL